VLTTLVNAQQVSEREEQKHRNDDRRREGVLPSSKVVGDYCWQEKNFKSFKKMTKTDEQMDEAAAHAQIIRINAQNVGGDIIRYRRNLAETDAFLGKIENHDFTFLPLALWRKGINIFCISFLFINVINLSSINEKGIDPSSYAKSVSW